MSYGAAPFIIRRYVTIQNYILAIWYREAMCRFNRTISVSEVIAIARPIYVKNFKKDADACAIGSILR